MELKYSKSQSIQSHVFQQMQPILDDNVVVITLHTTTLMCGTHTVCSSGDYPTTVEGKTVLVFLVIDFGGDGKVRWRWGWGVVYLQPCSLDFS